MEGAESSAQGGSDTKTGSGLFELRGDSNYIFPGQVKIAAAEVAVGGNILVETTTPLTRQLAESKGVDDGPRTQVKVLLHQGG